jgi:hypothetical protein
VWLLNRLFLIFFWSMIFFLLSIRSESREPVAQPENYVYSIRFQRGIEKVSSCTVFKVIYKKKHFLVTASHCCEAFSEEVRGYIVTERGLVMTTAMIDNPGSDLCLLNVPRFFKRDNEGLEMSILCSEDLTVIGFPKGQYKVITETKHLGYYYLEQLGLPYSNKYMPKLRYTSIGGQSGGPVLNSENQVTGVVIYGADSLDISLFVPVARIYRLLERGIKYLDAKSSQ